MARTRKSKILRPDKGRGWKLGGIFRVSCSEEWFLRRAFFSSAVQCSSSRNAMGAAKGRAERRKKKNKKRFPTTQEEKETEKYRL